MPRLLLAALLAASALDGAAAQGQQGQGCPCAHNHSRTFCPLDKTPHQCTNVTVKRPCKTGPCPAPPPAPPTPPAANASLYGCLPPHDKQNFCDTSLSAEKRAALVVAQLTVPELIGMMQGDQPAVERLGIPAYHYGYEALHGMIENCPFEDRCFTSFPCSSAAVASFNRSLWHATGSAQIDEVRGMFNSRSPLANGNTLGGNGPVLGLHIRGPQLNPQREPRWGRNDNSPGEDAYLEGQYGAWMVLGGQVRKRFCLPTSDIKRHHFLPRQAQDKHRESTQNRTLPSFGGRQGADATGKYRFGEKRKAICEMKHFDAYSVEDGRDGLGNTYDISLRDLVDYYFVPLKSCIDIGDVGAFMCSYNAVNGTATCGDQWLMVDVVRNTWNYTGAETTSLFLGAFF